MDKKVVFISGPITGVPKYWEAFEAAMDEVSAAGYIPLVPSFLPTGMSFERYARICMAMIDSADAVLLLPGWTASPGASLEHQYCQYINKPACFGIPALREALGEGVKK